MTQRQVLALFLCAFLYHVAPEEIAPYFGHQAIAWETILRGACEVCLWLFVVDVAWREGGKVCQTGVLVGVFGVFLSIQRPVCRAFHPMDQIVRLPNGQFLCDVTGIDWAGWTLIASGVVAFYILAWTR